MKHFESTAEFLEHLEKCAEMGERFVGRKLAVRFDEDVRRPIIYLV